MSSILPVSIYFNKFHSGTSIKGQSAPINKDLHLIFESIRNGDFEREYKISEIREAKKLLKIEEDRVELLNLSDIDIKKDIQYQNACSNLSSLKNSIPRVTIGGVFKDESRSEGNLKVPSGLIDIDLDGLDNLEEIKSLLKKDKYTYSVFTTCGGDGLCLIFRIKSDRFKDAFEGIKEYLYETYKLFSLDSVHSNIANTRNLSYDPDIYVAQSLPPLFETYPRKKKEKEQKITFVYAKTDFEHCVNEIVKRQIDFCPTYEIYRAVGFAIADKFNKSGLDDFDKVCQFGDKYNKPQLIKDYKYFCRNSTGKKNAISTFFYWCQQNTIEVYSKETKLIASAASAAFKSGRQKEDVIKNLFAHAGLSESQTRDIVDQVFDNKIEFISSSGVLDEIQAFLKYNYNLKINSITGKFENNGEEWSEAAFNSCLIDVKKAIDKSDRKWTETILFSSFIPSYNPVTEFFNNNKDRIPKISFIDGNPVIPSIIQDLWLTLETKSANHIEKFGTKWIVGVIATWLGDDASPLELIFAGVLDKGKTYFIRNLLPKELQKYFAESKISDNDNHKVTMCQKLLINQNECGGRSVKGEEEHREILDLDVLTIRRPYRRDNEDMKRLCGLFGTSNNVLDIIKDKFGNRRIIVAEILKRNFEAFDKIDKTDLWMAAYALYKAGYKWKILGDDIKELNHHSISHEEHSLEYELICSYFEKCEQSDSLNCKFTASDIKVYIESRTNQKLRSKSIIRELYKLGNEVIMDKVGTFDKKYYNVKLKINPIEESKKLPF